MELYFNPRLREGGDFSSADVRIAQYISIHASAKEATYKAVLDFVTKNFNPRLREGGDGTVYWPDCLSGKFQSTPPRRRRRDKSTLTVGSALISIHASAKEATFAAQLAASQASQFQSTPPRRRRPQIRRR